MVCRYILYKLGLCMKKKYLIRIKGLEKDEQTQFITSNLTDNIIRLKAMLLVLLVIQLVIAFLILVPGIYTITNEHKSFYITVYAVIIPYILLFLAALNTMGNHIKPKTITFFRITILTGLMILLLWGAIIKVLSPSDFFQPNIYLLLLIAVSVIPYFNYWEIIAVISPAQIFLTGYLISVKPYETQYLLQTLMDAWGFALLSLLIAVVHYVDRVQYFKKDMQLTKQNNLLKFTSEIDALTSVFNRRKLDETMEIEWKRSSRTEKPFSFLLIDLDNFKSYNDVYGHIEGDLCLRKSALIMKNTLKRSMDAIFRYGGEEFGVILPFTDLKSAEIVAEKLRRNIENARIAHIQADRNILTISIGLTSKTGNKDDDYKTMYLEADKALYAAKRSGRNKVISFDK